MVRLFRQSQRLEGLRVSPDERMLATVGGNRVMVWSLPEGKPHLELKHPLQTSGVAFLRKSSMQLASKMRFVSAQLLALLTDELWLRNASHANAMARELECRVAGIDGVTVVRPVQANAVFAVLPAEVTARLQERFRFYTWDHTTGEVRWMCAWDTTVEDVEEFATAIAEEMGR